MFKETNCIKSSYLIIQIRHWLNIFARKHARIQVRTDIHTSEGMNARTQNKWTNEQMKEHERRRKRTIEKP